MNEKRFTFRPTPIKTHHLCEVLDNDKRLGFVRHSDVGNVVDLLNVMNDTFVVLAIENHNLIDKLNDQQARIKELEEENEQLKERNEKLQWELDKKKSYNKEVSMTEKRFELDYDDTDCACISNFLDKGEKLTDREVVVLLNELNEENQELKRLIKKMGELGGFNKHLIKTICEDLK